MRTLRESRRTGPYDATRRSTNKAIYCSRESHATSRTTSAASRFCAGYAVTRNAAYAPLRVFSEK